MDSVSSDEVYQDQILPHVSRTFALTIPQLPEGLRTAVTCAYLLCRIADTIEDEPALSPPETLAFLQRFSALLVGRGDPALLAREIEGRLTDRTLATERDLVSNMERVLGGVVGEMLTDLFCDYSPEIARHRPALSAIAASFAQGLQMTNILKDVWEDRSRGACWLPQDVFTPHGVDLALVSSEPFDPRFGAAFRELIGVAHAHLRNALDYTLLIPSKETGIRRFCLWAIGLAVLTLRKIEHNPRFTAGVQVKVTHSAVAMIRALTNVAGRSNWMLRALFALASRGLPLARLPELRRPRPEPISLQVAPAGEPEFTSRRSYGNSGS